MRLVQHDLASFKALGERWDRLARDAGSPFLTVAWLAAWWRAFAPEDAVALGLHAGDELVAGGLFRRQGRDLRAATNAHTNDWDVVAEGASARRRLLEEVATGGTSRLTLDRVPTAGGGAARARVALEGAGYRVVEQELPPSPMLDLPSSFDDLLAARSRNLRSQVRRRRRALEREGALALRVSTDGPQLGRDLDTFLALEASGWKGRSGTAIAADRTLAAMYRSFAASAAERGWMRLYVLELDGEPIAADYGCAFEGCGYLIKTGFDEDRAGFAPGLVLRAEALRASIDEGLRRYDFLGGPDDYKLRWAGDLRGRTALRAFRGARALPAYAWWAAVRPGMRATRGVLRGGVGRFRTRPLAPR